MHNLWKVPKQKFVLIKVACKRLATLLHVKAFKDFDLQWKETKYRASWYLSMFDGCYYSRMIGVRSVTFDGHSRLNEYSSPMIFCNISNTKLSDIVNVVNTAPSCHFTIQLKLLKFDNINTTSKCEIWWKLRVSLPINMQAYTVRKTLPPSLHKPLILFRVDVNAKVLWMIKLMIYWGSLVWKIKYCPWCKDFYGS